MIVLWIILGLVFAPVLAAVAFSILLATFLICGARFLLRGTPRR